MNDAQVVADGATDAGKEQELLLAQLERLGQQRLDTLDAAWQGRLHSFVRQFFDTSSLDSLRLRRPAQLVDIAYGQLQWAEVRHPGEVLVRSLPPAAPDALAVVETCVEDMPYLVDTVTLAIREAGVSIDWTAHPLLTVQRGADGRLRQVGALADGQSESWIHVEFEPLADAAAYAALEDKLRAALTDLQCAVADRAAMEARAKALADRLQQVPVGGDADEYAEAREFLLWLADEHFLFLGVSETRASAGVDGRTRLQLLPERSLGLAREGRRYADADALIAPREELDKYADSPRIVVVTKANQRSVIHLAEALDVISVKQHSATGAMEGTVRFIGLFAAEVYADRPRSIPLIRRKAEYVMKRSRLREDSHSGKWLQEILFSLPRDELFQSSEEELFRTTMGIRALRDRHQLKLFLRRDRYGRFYSAMIYLPRERYSRELRDRLGQELLRVFGGLSVERNVDFLRGPLARIRYIVRTPPGTQIALTAEEIEHKLIAATRSWREQLREVLVCSAGAAAASIAQRFADAFPLSYTEEVAPLDAAADLQYLLRLSPQQTLLPRLMVDTATAQARVTGLKLYSYDRPVALSDVLPTLENFGLRVIRQEPTDVRPKDSPTLWIQDFAVEAPASKLPPERLRAYFESALLATWQNRSEDDGLNRLVLAAGLDARQVTCLRALAKYINQIGLPYGRSDIEQLLAGHADIARLLVRLFEARLDPARDAGQRQSEQARYAQELETALDTVTSLDADRVLRAFVSVVQAATRTNFFQPAADGSVKPYVSIKLDPSKIPELPQPRPLFEIWVYAPEVEGVHLRGGRVARGGLRWSDRREDFRTEVLGLMKAQMVKNAVIVPVGAKGGFVVKRAVDPSDRDAWMAQGIDCYRIFLRGLLDITDNRVGDSVVAPPSVVRLDSDDPYLVVAADKGTASFSDIANGIAAEYGFWLGDAFASGGSAGYDHKKMGITARGAWESVKRHFRELSVDIQTQPFTVVGIGDMSGDVFGNGMLLSRQIRLLAAFDHRHIFIDPDPDPEISYAERERLFRLPRSSWADYDATRLSPGGGIYPRSVKLITLSPQAQKALGVERERFTPPQLIRALLAAPVDLLWNGGIGTYVKAREQSHVDVRDRANDAIRLDGRELRCRVVGEGGNLGFTQAGRIEYAMHGGPRTAGAASGSGGRINTDAIDNAGGVHCSDREVNIKIPLNRLMLEGGLAREQRDPLLAQMTDDIAAFVLRDNYVQSAGISLVEREAAQRLDEHVALIRTLERDGLLNRSLEALPDEDTLKERRSDGCGLTRPEIAVLMAYAKISLKDAALKSDVPDDPLFERDLLDNFPQLLVERYAEALRQHRLRREIVATMLCNGIVNRMGISFAHRMAEDYGVTRAQVLKAFAVAQDIFRSDGYWRGVEALDNRVPADLQYRLMHRIVGLLRHATAWLIGADGGLSAGELVARYKAAVAQVETQLPEALTGAYREQWERAAQRHEAEGVPAPLAKAMANTRVLGSALDIAELSLNTPVPLADAAAVYFRLGERLRLPWLHAAILQLKAAGPWQALARGNLRDDVYRLHRRLAESALRHTGASPEARVEAWAAAREARLRFVLARLTELQASGAADFQALAVAVRELRRLRSA